MLILQGVLPRWVARSWRTVSFALGSSGRCIHSPLLLWNESGWPQQWSSPVHSPRQVTAGRFDQWHTVLALSKTLYCEVYKRLSSWVTMFKLQTAQFSIFVIVPIVQMRQETDWWITKLDFKVIRLNDCFQHMWVLSTNGMAYLWRFRWCIFLLENICQREKHEHKSPVP